MDVKSVDTYQSAWERIVVAIGESDVHADHAQLEALANGIFNSLHDAGLILTPANERVVLENAMRRIGWKEIDAFGDELAKGQGIHEDGGGFFARAISALFGVKPRGKVETYQSAAQALIDSHCGGRT